MQRLAARGIAILIVSDDLPELLQNCDRILMMRKGRVAQTFVAEGLSEAELYRSLLAEAA